MTAQSKYILRGILAVLFFHGTFPTTSPSETFKLFDFGQNWKFARSKKENHFQIMNTILKTFVLKQCSWNESKWVLYTCCYYFGYYGYYGYYLGFDRCFIVYMVNLFKIFENILRLKSLWNNFEWCSAKDGWGWSFTVADPGYPRQGAPTSKRLGLQPIIYSNFCQKLHEYYRILIQRGAHVPGAPLDPPLV